MLTFSFIFNIRSSKIFFVKVLACRPMWMKGFFFSILLGLIESIWEIVGIRYAVIQPGFSTKNNLGFHSFIFYTTPVHYSFLPRSIREWNSLPQHCMNQQALDNPATFRSVILNQT